MKAKRARSRRTTERELETALETLLQKDVSKVTILAVAKEAGVSSALIHNKYPVFAEKVRVAIGKGMKTRHDEACRMLEAHRERNRQLRAQCDALIKEVRDLASENESLRRELAIQQAMGQGSVTRLPVTRSGR